MSLLANLLIHGGFLLSAAGSTWLLYHSFNIRRKNKSVFSTVHHFGGICVILLTLSNLFRMYQGYDLLPIEMIYIGLSMIMCCTFAISVMKQLPPKNTRTQRVFSFAVVMGTNIGLSFLFQFYSFKFHQTLYPKDYLSICVCLLLILHGLVVTLLDLTDCVLVLMANILDIANPMKCMEPTTYYLDLQFHGNPLYLYFLRTPLKIFERKKRRKDDSRSNSSRSAIRSDGEEPLTTIKTPVIWIGLIAQLVASVAYGYFNVWFLIAGDIESMGICTDGYLIGLQLRQQFCLAVIPNCMAMFAATLVFKGKVKVTRWLMAFMAIWILFGFAFMFAHKLVFIHHQRYADLPWLFAFLLQC